MVCRPLTTLGRGIASGPRVMISSLFERLFLQTAGCDSHELIQDNELKLQVQRVAEGLQRIANAQLVETY